MRNLKKDRMSLESDDDSTVENRSSTLFEETLSFTNAKHVDKLQGRVSWNLSDSFHLRLLIHYVGDIH